jgi:hypothetical protein
VLLLDLLDLDEPMAVANGAPHALLDEVYAAPSAAPI